MNIEKKLRRWRLIFIGSSFMLVMTFIGLFASAAVKTSTPYQNQHRIKTEVVVKKPQYKLIDGTVKEFKLQQKLLIF